jgi:hypothetical protein
VARSNRSQQSRGLIFALHSIGLTLWTVLARGQQHSSMTRAMPWQKYRTRPSAPTGSASNSTATIARIRA